MKNKTKLAKIKESAAKKKGNMPPVPDRWFYMSEQTLTVGEIGAVLSDRYDVHVWTEAGVIECGFAEKASLDMEKLEIDLGDEYSNSYLEEHKVDTLYYISFPAEHSETCCKIMQSLVNKLGGFCCGDTEDFTPVLKGTGEETK